MPTYEFVCTKCKARFTEKQSFGEFDRGKAVKCPKCSSKKVRQRLTASFAKTAKKS